MECVSAGGKDGRLGAQRKDRFIHSFIHSRNSGRASILFPVVFQKLDILVNKTRPLSDVLYVLWEGGR